MGAAYFYIPAMAFFERSHLFFYRPSAWVRCRRNLYPPRVREVAFLVSTAYSVMGI